MTDTIVYTGKLPAPYNLECYQGESWSLTVEYLDENDDPVSLTGYTAYMTVKEEASGVSRLALSSPSTGITITAATGKIDVVMTHAQTEAFQFQEGVYDLLIISGSSTYTYLLSGKFTVTPSTTKTS